jgi:16S rRNA (cytosine967-C5)-methyltransferase
VNSLAKLTARLAAATILTEVTVRQRSLNSALASTLAELDERERGFCQQLCYGVLRWYPSLQFLAGQLLSKPLKNKDADIFNLLLIGLYQLRDLRTPSHAAISETVNTSKQLGKKWASGLLNACLRNYQRQQQQLETALQANASAKQAHPDWLLKQYQTDWPEHSSQICDANNQQPPMMLRVNQLQQSREDYLTQLSAAGIAAAAVNDTEHGILLTQACDVSKLPGFDTGAVSVQDGAAQITARLLDIQSGQLILDACAAPGGKTGHILESAPDIKVIALDVSEDRLQQVESNLSRLQLSATLKAADAGQTDVWWDGELFDRILIDAPCTGSGVIRRHPDIKLLRRADDSASLAAPQKQLLDSLWPLLKADGLMVYTTCSAFKQENEQQIDAFLQRHPDAEEVRPEQPPAQARPFGYQRLPGDDIMDGFYYACLRRR